MLYKMYAETSVRDGFVIRDEGYYKTVWELFMRSNVDSWNSHVEFQPSNVTNRRTDHRRSGWRTCRRDLCFLFCRRAYYVYGMSRDVHREKMPNYLLQWEAMKRAKAKGCTAYDLWGAPEVFDESDSMWGVYRFKEGLGGQVVRTLGAWDFAPSPLWYKMYSEIIPRVLDVMRSRGKARTKQNLGRRVLQKQLRWSSGCRAERSRSGVVEASTVSTISNKKILLTWWSRYGFAGYSTTEDF
jgi:peptidoglycan pentaglycine glycine transferase (the first glycine)